MILESPPIVRPSVQRPSGLKPRSKVERDQSAFEKYGLTFLLLLAFIGSLGILNWDPPVFKTGFPSHPSGMRARKIYAPVHAPTLPTLNEDIYREHIQNVLNIIQRNINPDTYLAYSFTGDKRLEYWSVVYDNMIRALVHLRTGRVDLAKKAVDYFIENTAIQKFGWVIKNGKPFVRAGWVINIVDASEDRPGGRGIEHIAHTGPNVYLGIAAIHIYNATGEKKYLRFARKQWLIVKDLQNENPSDPNFGGVRMGPMGNPENPREQKLDFNPKNPSFYEFYNGEHAADFMGFCNLMAQIDVTYKERYEHASELIAHWDKRIYDPVKHLFFIGTTEKRYFDANIGQWVNPGVIPMYPLDTSSLKISAYGVDGLERFEPNAAEKIRHAIDENFKVTVEIPGADGKLQKVTGYDFVTHDQRKQLVRFKELGPYGDRKVKKGIGRKPLLTDEWSNWVALADLRLSDDFLKNGQKNKSNQYLSSYYQNALVEGMRTAIPVDGGLAYPYCHPLPDALNQPVGFGWNTHHVPYAVIGGEARILGMLRFDPFRLNGGDRSTTMDIQIENLAQAPGDRRDKTILYTEAELYLRDAWRDVRVAQINGPNSAKYWGRALVSVEKMLAEHKDWIQVAKNQNILARNSTEKFPLSGIGNLTTRDLEPVYRKYWALYHIGTAEFIVVMANASLRDLAREKGDYAVADNFNKQAIAAARTITTDFNQAQTFDENGWLWQPAEAIKEYVDLS